MAVGSGPAGYRSIVGRRFGLGPTGPLYNGRPVGAQPAALGRGDTYYVDSAIDMISGVSPEEAVGTLDEAFALTTANQGDVIVVMPNHAETVTAAGGIAHDVAGVSVIGLGNYNQRPRILMDAGTATYDVSAADAYIENIVFASGHLLSAVCFDVTAVGCHINNVHWDDNTTAENWGTPVKATGAANSADGLKVTNCRWTPLVATVNALEFIEITDNIDDLVISGNYISHEGTASPVFLQAGSKVMHNAVITHNFLSHKMTTGDLAWNNGGSTNSGVIAHNRIGHADVTGAHELGAATGMRFFDNLSVSTAILSGVVIPAIDVDL